ncbi:2-oxoglutarate dehydrogenase complex dihydrolipoyllysine-residue succinyltransferase [Oleiharenicola lentus]|uniref:Dihydrolipoyllysine-residue succinyltransferase component of 2-oxoglutarate dehydrogenase complex n=1 Tax=Oleiharenicola lentus TaxID=2508720 RepID=A0A4Q1C8X3_9BACT|nr:2-oxoglutarate dehydrogenase complex dihydrolipoyllysine-residue succinyltransferase [Oleiharenicola lentus]RXK55437.1 2-oxoglutarate dehydrogenase complex dihydrolipoyllysine-residue succinyltransferase [Oleiharenicola lentus]
MAIDVKIPPMGESITSGVLAKWHVADGTIVKKDQPLFELETDKITSEGTAEADGKLTIKVAAGTDVKIGEVVATIDETATAGASVPAASSQKLEVENQKSGDVVASPAVRRLAAETGIDPATVTGTGKAGRVTKGDMLAASVSKPPFAAPAPAATAPVAAPSVASAKERQTRTKMSKLRQTIAKRLVSAQHEAAMLTTFNEVDMSAVMELRKKYQDDFVKKHGVKLGFMSFFTKAVVHALREVPGVNATIDGDTVVQNHYYDISMAVSTDKGLMVPVIRGCDTLDMAGIEKAIAETAKKAREGKIGLDDLSGGVFTITNGGIFGSMLSTPILNAPQSAILGLHAINERPIALNGQVVIRPMMYLALSYDHRLVDGKEAVTFLVKVKQAIEDPARLLIGA